MCANTKKLHRVHEFTLPSTCLELETKTSNSLYIPLGFYNSPNNFNKPWCKMNSQELLILISIHIISLAMPHHLLSFCILVYPIN